MRTIFSLAALAYCVSAQNDINSDIIDVIEIDEDADFVNFEALYGKSP
jgi:hypothetical protein